MAKKVKRADTDALEHSVEIEQKFEVPPGFGLPDLTGLPRVATVDEPVVLHLDATYLDTPELGLFAHRWVLRRRTGGEDAGWHLKRPAAAGRRDEYHHPLGRSSRVPVAIRRGVAVHARGRTLVPIAHLATTRTVSLLRDDAGQVLAEVMLDAVRATALNGDGSALAASDWQEAEVELKAGDDALLGELANRMRQAGATSSASRSKLSQALAPRLEAAPVAAVEPPTRYGPSSAVGVVLAYLAGEVSHLQVNDPRVRVDAPDAVHQMRVAARRLRSALATFRALFDAAVTDPIRDELAWLGVELGAARDVEVIRDHLLGAVAAQPTPLLHGPVAERIGAAMDQRYAEAHTHGVAQLNSRRYFRLLDSLDALVTTPPLAEHAAAAPVEELLGLVRRTWRKLNRLHRELADLSDPVERDLQLHEVRKAAKRARYAGEALTPSFGRHAAQYASRMGAIQSVLGDHQDTVVIRHELETLTTAAEAAGEPSFTYGRLHAQEEGRAERTENDFAQAWAAASAPAVRRWLKN